MRSNILQLQNFLQNKCGGVLGALPGGRNVCREKVGHVMSNRGHGVNKVKNAFGLTAAAGLAGLGAAPAQAAEEGFLDSVTKTLGPLLVETGFGPEAATDPLIVANVLAGALAVLVAIGCAVWAAAASSKIRRLHVSHEMELEQLGARVDMAEAILRSEPEALLIWSPETMTAKPGTLQSRPRIAGSTAALADPATGDVDYEQILRRMTGETAGLLRNAVDNLRSRGARFSMLLQSTDGRTFQAQGRPAGAQAVVWIRDVTGERAEVGKFVERATTAETAREVLLEQMANLPVPAWRRDGEGRLQWVNPAYARAVDMTGPDEVVEKGLELLNDEDNRKVRQHVSAGDMYRGRFYALVSGERRALEVSEFLLTDGSAGIATDVTALDDAETELKRHIDAHGGTLDRLATPVAIFGSDKRLKFFNKAYVKFWDLDAEWLASEPSDGEVLDALRTARRLPEQANFQAWKSQMMAIYQAAEPAEEFWHLPDGQTVRMVAQAHPMGGVIYIYENVTEQLNLESSYNTVLRVQGETLDNLFEGVAVFGSDGRLKLHNPAFTDIWRLSEDMLSRSPHVAEVIEICRDLYDEGTIWEDMKSRITSVGSARRQMSERMERADGTIIDCAMVPLPDGATLLTYVDVTDASRIERALRDRNDALETADRLKSEFISHVSYQLRTPLTAIIGFTEILEAEMFGTLLPRQHEYTTGILDSSNELLDTVNDILDLSTIEAGAMALDLADVSIPDLLGTAELFARQRIQNTNVQLEVECDPATGSFEADEKRIRQILINLISNAVAYTKAGDTITLGATRRGSELQLYVADTGEGIKPEHQATVFDRFEARGGADRRRGAGLGLSLVRSFVELHGGWVTLESAPDMGTRVTCHLPMSAPDKEIPAELDAETL